MRITQDVLVFAAAPMTARDAWPIPAPPPGTPRLTRAPRHVPQARKMRFTRVRSACIAEPRGYR